MKRDPGAGKLSVLTLLFGIAALLLRWGLYMAAMDAKGLLQRNHPLEIALTVLTAAVLVFLVLAVRKTENSGIFEECYGADIPAAMGSVAAGAGILVTAVTGAPDIRGYLETVWKFLSLAAPVCMVLAGIARIRGKKPFFLLHVAVCLFFILHAVTRYQHWSSNPQLQDYLFSLLGCLALMFFGFYAAALEAGCGSRRMTLGMGLAAVYLCMAELARSSDPALYLGGILWVLTDLGSLRQLAADKQK